LQATATIDEALRRNEHSEERWCTPELLRIKGAVVLQRGAAHAAAMAEDDFVKSIQLARRQEALAWELRTATSLARLWWNQGRISEATNSSHRSMVASARLRNRRSWGSPRVCWVNSRHTARSGRRRKQAVSQSRFANVHKALRGGFTAPVENCGGIHNVSFVRDRGRGHEWAARAKRPMPKPKKLPSRYRQRAVAGAGDTAVCRCDRRRTSLVRVVACGCTKVSVRYAISRHWQPSARLEDRVIAVGPTGSVRLRVVRPEGASEALPAVVYVHGGG